MKKEKQRPKVGVGVFVIKGSKVLLGKRKGSHGAGAWCPPGGYLEMFESWEECVRREAREEAGVEIKNVRFMAVNNDLYKKEGKHFVTLELVADWKSGEPQLVEPDKFEKWGWFAWGKLPKPLFLSTRNFIKKGYNPFKI